MFSLLQHETAAFLNQFRLAAECFAAPHCARELDPSQRALARLERAVQAPLRIVLLGEPGAGKSSFAHFLLGRQPFPGGLTMKARPHVLFRYAAEPSIHAISPNGTRARLTSKALAQLGGRPEESSVPKVIYSAVPRHPEFGLPPVPHGISAAGNAPQLVEVGLPAPILRHLEIIDTHGIPEPHLPNWSVFRHARLAVWCTVATQAWKESERAAWSQVPQIWRDNGLLAVTYKEALRSDAERLKLERRLDNETGGLFAGRVILAAKEAGRLAERRAEGHDAPGWMECGAAAATEAVRGLYARAAADRLWRAQSMAKRIMVRDTRAAPAEDAGMVFHPALQAG